MNQADEILVIILSIVLIVLLLLMIWAIAYVIKLLKTANRIASDTSRIIDSAESVTSALKDATGPVAFFGLINTLVKSMNKQRRDK